MEWEGEIARKFDAKGGSDATKTFTDTISVDLWRTLCGLLIEVSCRAILPLSFLYFFFFSFPLSCFLSSSCPTFQAFPAQMPRLWRLRK